MEAKKKDDVETELRKCPKVQQYLIDIIKNGIESDIVQEVDEFESEMTDEDFELLALEDAAKIKKGIKDSEAEEVESSWEDI